MDTSSPSGSVALLDDNDLVSESLIEGSPAYSDKLLFQINAMLNGSGTKLNEIDGFVITTGPGSFTGLRVGISLLKGFILATEKPFASVNTLEAYAKTIQPGPYVICPVLDARKKEVYTALFNSENDQCVRSTPDQAISAADLCDQIKFVHNVPTKNQTVAASAVLIANVEKNLHYDLDSLMINYVRPSEAELNYTVPK
jgi:tRNA threonylcarbamoyladenosine biosynthesis protein TsaB